MSPHRFPNGLFIGGSMQNVHLVRWNLNGFEWNRDGGILFWFMIGIGTGFEYQMEVRIKFQKVKIFSFFLELDWKQNFFLIQQLKWKFFWLYFSNSFQLNMTLIYKNASMSLHGAFVLMPYFLQRSVPKQKIFSVGRAAPCAKRHPNFAATKSFTDRSALAFQDDTSSVYARGRRRSPGTCVGDGEVSERSGSRLVSCRKFFWLYVWLCFPSIFYPTAQVFQMVMRDSLLLSGPLVISIRFLLFFLYIELHRVFFEQVSCIHTPNRLLIRVEPKTRGIREKKIIKRLSGSHRPVVSKMNEKD